MDEIKPSNQEEFMKANSDVDEMIQKLLLEKLRNRELNISDYRILSRAYSAFNYNLFVEVAMQVLENHV
jgi:hypothetical protein